MSQMGNPGTWNGKTESFHSKGIKADTLAITELYRNAAEELKQIREALDLEENKIPKSMIPKTMKELQNLRSHLNDLFGHVSIDVAALISALRKYDYDLSKSIILDTLMPDELKDDADIAPCQFFLIDMLIEHGSISQTYKAQEQFAEWLKKVDNWKRKKQTLKVDWSKLPKVIKPKTFEEVCEALGL